MKLVINDDVISEWTRKRLDFRRTSGFAWMIYVAIIGLLIAPAAVGFIDPLPWIFAVGFIAVAIGSYLRVRHQFVLKCPNCGEIPGRSHGQLSLLEVDYCPHCCHWLLHPRRG